MLEFATQWRPEYRVTYTYTLSDAILAKTRSLQMSLSPPTDSPTSLESHH